jgi:integrase
MGCCKEKIIDWSKTKNDQPHAVPVPSLAAELIESITPNEYGWYFPSATDPFKASQPRHALQLCLAAAGPRGDPLS